MIYVRDENGNYRVAHVTNKWTKQNGFWKKAYADSWAVGDWGPCEGVCGTQGTQHRIMDYKRIILNRENKVLEMHPVFANDPNRPANSKPCYTPVCPTNFYVQGTTKSYYSWTRVQKTFELGYFSRVVVRLIHTYKSVVWWGTKSYPTNDTIIFNNSNEHKSASYYDGRDNYNINKDITHLCIVGTNYLSMNILSLHQGTGGGCAVYFQAEY